MHIFKTLEPLCFDVFLYIRLSVCRGKGWDLGDFPMFGASEKCAFRENDVLKIGDLYY